MSGHEGVDRGLRRIGTDGGGFLRCQREFEVGVGVGRIMSRVLVGLGAGEGEQCGVPATRLDPESQGAQPCVDLAESVRHDSANNRKLTAEAAENLADFHEYRLHCGGSAVIVVGRGSGGTSRAIGACRDAGDPQPRGRVRPPPPNRGKSGPGWCR